MKQLKGLWILAAVVIVVRIVLEEAGVAEGLHNVLGVTWLLLLVPIYLGVKSSGDIKGAAKSSVVFLIGVRFMVMLTYMLAWVAGFSAPRFSVAGGGVVGQESALWGLLLTPLTNFAGTVVVGGLIAALLGAGSAWIAGKMKLG